MASLATVFHQYIHIHTNPIIWMNFSVAVGGKSLLFIEWEKKITKIVRHHSISAPTEISHVQQFYNKLNCLIFFFTRLFWYPIAIEWSHASGQKNHITKWKKKNNTLHHAQFSGIVAKYACQLFFISPEFRIHLYHTKFFCCPFFSMHSAHTKNSNHWARNERQSYEYNELKIHVCQLQQRYRWSF